MNDDFQKACSKEVPTDVVQTTPIGEVTIKSTGEIEIKGEVQVVPMSPEAQKVFDEVAATVDRIATDGPKLFDPLPPIEENAAGIVTSEHTSEPAKNWSDEFEKKNPELVKEAREEMEEIEFWLELDAEHDKEDEYVVPVDDHLKEVEALMAKVEGLELVNKELSEANKDGATVIKAFVAYRKWVLSLGQKFSETINGTLGWREKIAAGKRFAKELTDAASQFDIGLTAKVETEEDKATKKEKQRDMIVRVYDMATQSLSPEIFEGLEKALVELAQTRKIKWEPQVREKKEG